MRKDVIYLHTWLKRILTTMLFGYKSANKARDWRVFLSCAILLASIAGYQQVVRAAGSQSRALITAPVSDHALVTLKGNTRPEATAANDRGAVAADFPMDHMLLQLRRPPEQEQALDRYIDELEDPKSPHYHHWLSAKQIGERYGLAAEDLDTIKTWLRSHGFKINKVYPNEMVIDFSGTAGEVSDAFHTEIHHLDVNGAMHIANMSDPQIPAALAPAVVGVVSLNDFRPQTQSYAIPNYAYSCSGDGFGSPCEAVAPPDLATIYNLNPLFTAGLSGQGQTIVVIEDSDPYSLSDWSTFRSTYALSSTFPDGSVSEVHPGSCTDPGIVSGAEFEATIDAEWASAAAPSAAIELATCAGTSSTPGQVLALENLVNGEAKPPAILSNSYGTAEALQGATLNAAINSAYQTAVTNGVSVFVAAGDSGAAYADQGFDTIATRGIAVNGAASTQYNVAVGGTDFGDTYQGLEGDYWSTTNSASSGSALSYVPEIPWNSTCAGSILTDYLGFPSTVGSDSTCNNGEVLSITAGSGGPSGCATGAPSTAGVVSGTCAGYAKPSWQSVLGNPSDGVRDIPDVSLFSSNYPWGHSYVYCDSDPAEGGCNPGGGGTSFASPIMAGIQSLINQRTGSRQSNPNPTYYALASTEYGTSGSTTCKSSLGNAVGSSCIFYDITQGDNDVPCTGKNNCLNAGGTYGALSTSTTGLKQAYSATTGWDFATGIGSVNAYNLVMAFDSSATPTPSATATATATATSSPSRTATPTATATRTATATATATRTATATATATKTATSTATATTTATATVTATPTATATRTATSTATATRTATATATATATSTPTRTATPSASATATSTVTKTPTATSTATATATPTATSTRTATATPTATGTSTASRTATPTASATTTATATSTVTPTATPTRTATATSTATKTATPSATSTQTVTATSTQTATLTATPTATATPTHTATATPTVSATATRTPTATATATGTSTATRTATPTATATTTSTATATATATATPTATATQTPTATPTPIEIEQKLTIKPHSLKFGDQTAVGGTSAAKTVKIRNAGKKKTLSVNIQVETSSSSAFVVKSECDKTLAPGKSCKVRVTFNPMNTTAQTGSLKIYDNVIGSPQSVSLSGTGKAVAERK
jgi:subtilase family serine protease